MVYYFSSRPISTIIMRREGWMDYLFTSVVLIAPTFYLDFQAPRWKKIPTRKKTSFFQIIFLSINMSIYDELYNNIHTYIGHIGMRGICQVMY